MKKPTRKKIKRLASTTTRQITEAETRVEALVLKLDKILSGHLSDTLSKLGNTKDVSSREAGKVLSDLHDILDTPEYAKVQERLRAHFGTELQSINEVFRNDNGKAAIISGIAKEDLDALVDTRLELVSDSARTHLGDVRDYLMQQVIAGQSVAMSDIDGGFGETFTRNMTTELTTSTMAYNRLANQLKAEKAGLTKFLYIGPDDDVIRPFCEERVGQIFTQEEIDSWDNGTDLPANIYLGGYNCRHHLRPVSEDLAEEIEAESEEELTVEEE